MSPTKDQQPKQLCTSNSLRHDNIFVRHELDQIMVATPLPPRPKQRRLTPLERLHKQLNCGGMQFCSSPAASPDDRVRYYLTRTLNSSIESEMRCSPRAKPMAVTVAVASKNHSPPRQRKSRKANGLQKKMAMKEGGQHDRPVGQALGAKVGSKRLEKSAQIQKKSQSKHQC